MISFVSTYLKNVKNIYFPVNENIKRNTLPVLAGAV